MSANYKCDEDGKWWQWENGKWVPQYDGIDPFTGYTRTAAAIDPPENDDE